MSKIRIYGDDMDIQELELTTDYDPEMYYPHRLQDGTDATFNISHNAMETLLEIVKHLDKKVTELELAQGKQATKGGEDG